MSESSIGPVQAQERMQALDIIRGFALLGILLMNIEYFQRPLQAVMLGLDTAQTGLDYAVGWFSYAFVQGKFYTMFSLLFGLGFVLFLDRAAARTTAPRWLFTRRLLVLMAFGAAHAFLVWSGDILLIYSIVGLLLLLFAHTPARRLWKWGLAAIAVPVALFWLLAGLMAMALQSPEGPKILADMAANSAALQADLVTGAAVYSEGTWAEAVRWRMHEVGALYVGVGALFFIPSILGMFLIGASFGRARVFAEPAAHQPLFHRMVGFGFGVGIPAALLVGLRGPGTDMMAPSTGSATLMTVQVIANLALCLAYIGTLMVLLHRGKTWLMHLAPLGRMALTNYLMHSVVFTLLFYGYGLGLYGDFGRAAATLMAIGLYAAQIVMSGWWLRHFRMGPMEWVWRTLTYGRLQPFRSRHSAT